MSRLIRVFHDMLQSLISQRGLSCEQQMKRRLKWSLKQAVSALCFVKWRRKYLLIHTLDSTLRPQIAGTPSTADTYRHILW
jgi:hypothetical protein